jgi:hypothetical protein
VAFFVSQTLGRCPRLAMKQRLWREHYRTLGREDDIDLPQGHLRRNKGVKQKETKIAKGFV